jgi:HSP20 family protein
MAIVRWDPFKDLHNLQERMNRLFEDSLMRPRIDESRLMSGTWTPLVDIYETKDTIVIRAEVPGVKQEDLNIEVNENTLILKGERKPDKEVKEENYHCIERSYGHFLRSFTLPRVVQQDKICARLKDGVLEITLPKADEAKSKQIEIITK